jgi:hypothetical protein
MLGLAARKIQVFGYAAPALHLFNLLLQNKIQSFMEENSKPEISEGLPSIPHATVQKGVKEFAFVGKKDKEELLFLLSFLISPLGVISIEFCCCISRLFGDKLETMEDEDVALSPETLAALKEFLVEKEQREKLESVLQQGEVEEMSTESTVEKFEEDWQLSQFWVTNDCSK